MNTTANSWRATECSWKGNGLLSIGNKITFKEMSVFHEPYHGKKMWLVISNTYFKSYLNARWLLKMFKPSVIQGSKLGEVMERRIPTKLHRRCSYLLCTLEMKETNSVQSQYWKEVWLLPTLLHLAKLILWCSHCWYSRLS